MRRRVLRRLSSCKCSLSAIICIYASATSTQILRTLNIGQATPLYQYNFILSLTIDFGVVNSADPDAMLHYVGKRTGLGIYGLHTVKTGYACSQTDQSVRHACVYSSPAK